MKAHSYLFGIMVILLSLVAMLSAVYLALTTKKPAPLVIASFADCEKAGFAVLQSEPEECKTPDGRTFIAEVEGVVPPVPEPIATSTRPKLAAPILSNLSANAKIASPLTISGSVSGGWYFEASFPVIIEDASGNTLAEAPAKAQADWMTASLVPFTVDLAWATTTATSGVLILKKDNPSGLPENDQEVRIPVTF